MSHVALYRKYRPDTFEGIVAQDHITRILKNQIVNSKVGHAYIFSGSRGTGKTSAAKVFARAVNCLNNKEGNPCNVSENCLSILNGSTSDVIEMDAASNNSVDAIREIRQEVIYATTTLKYRVYIIDEAHMLTTSAFNALLKTLEEPPENVIFILATTEQHKILPTIISRCMRFEFKRIPENKIYNNLIFILENEKKTFEEKALRYISRAADGGMRDALSILERCIDESEELKFDEIQELIGNISADNLKNIILPIIEYNPTAALKRIENVINDGKDVRQLSNELLNEFMNILIYISTENIETFTIFDSEELAVIKQKLIAERLNEILLVLNELDNDLRMSLNPIVIFKAKIITLAMVKIKTDEKETIIVNKTDNDNSKLYDELDYLKDEIEKIKSTGVVLTNTINTSNSEDLTKKLRLFRPWYDVKKEIENNRNLLLYSLLVKTTAIVAGDTVYLFTDNEFSKENLQRVENREKILDAIEKITDKEFNLVVSGENNNNVNQNKDEIEKLLEQNNIQYEEI